MDVFAKWNAVKKTLKWKIIIHACYYVRGQRHEQPPCVHAHGEASPSIYADWVTGRWFLET